MDNFIFVALKFCQNEDLQCKFSFYDVGQKDNSEKTTVAVPSVEKVVKKCSHFLLFAFSHEWSTLELVNSALASSLRK